EMHLLASICAGATIASVGQASIQRVQVPQKSPANGASYSNGKSTISVARKKKDPDFLVIRLAFLPIQPKPVSRAQARSSTGALSTNPRPSTAPISALIASKNWLSLLLMTS